MGLLARNDRRRRRLGHIGSRLWLRRRIELEEFLHHVMNRRRRRGAAMTAMLDQACDRDPRMVLGRVRDEPRVIAQPLGLLVLRYACAFSLLHDLRGAGLAAHDDAL